MTSSTHFRLFARTGPRVALGLALAAMAGSATIAQDVAPPASQGAIVIPENLTIFGKNDPNVRKATAVVNGDVITGTDVDQRVALIVNANEGRVSPEEMNRLRLQVLRNLIDETLQIQEAAAQKIEVEDAEIEQSYARVASQNFGQNVKALDAYLTRIGSSPNSLKRQIRGELSWQRLQRRNIMPFVNVSDEEVRELLERLKASKGTEEYHIGEIFLAATPETSESVQANAMKIVEQLRQGGSFVAYARQFSQASTASVGGDLGWVRLAQLPAELASTAQQLQPSQMAGPIQIPGGYSILMLIDKRKVLTADPRDAVLSLKQISIAFAPGTSQDEATRRAGQFATAIRGANGCGGVDAVAAQIGAEVVANDQVRARDLPGPLQEAMLSLSPGETTPPFGSVQDGVRMLMLCGRDDPQDTSGPNFDQIQAQLEDERVNKRAQMYLRDLRRDAVIDYN